MCGNNRVQEISFLTCCGSCCGDFREDIPVSLHHTLLPAIASGSAGGNLGPSGTEASGLHCLSHLSTKVTKLIREL